MNILLSLAFGLCLISSFYLPTINNFDLHETKFGPQPGIDSIAIYGDTRSQPDIHQMIVNNIVWQKPIAAIHVGDLVNDGNSQEEWDNYNNITSTLNSQIPFYPVPGNHENNSPLFYKNFNLPNDLPWYSVNTRNIHFIMLDSDSIHPINPQSAQYKWLVSDLENIPSSTEYIIPIFHHPLLTNGTHV